MEKFLKNYTVKEKAAKIVEGGKETITAAAEFLMQNHIDEMMEFAADYTEILSSMVCDGEYDKEIKYAEEIVDDKDNPYNEWESEFFSLVCDDICKKYEEVCLENRYISDTMAKLIGIDKKTIDSMPKETKEIFYENMAKVFREVIDESIYDEEDFQEEIVETFSDAYFVDLKKIEK